MQMTSFFHRIRGTIRGTFPVSFMNIHCEFGEIYAFQKLADFWIFGQPGETRFSSNAYESCKVSPTLTIYNFYSILQGKHGYFLTNTAKIAIFFEFLPIPGFPTRDVTDQKIFE